jgi:hypothetical protein
MKNTKTIGMLLIAGAVGVLVPYTVLTIIFDYPDVLREDPGVVLTRFHASGPQLILVWWAFALLGLPLLPAYIRLGQWLQRQTTYMQWVTAVGVVSIVVQMVGLLRWVFVVPVLAQLYVGADTEGARTAATVVFQAFHQFGGVLLGEHLGQLFTVVWTFMVSLAFLQLRLFPRWVAWFGMATAGIYALAQAELAATVIPGFPVWEAAGFIGSTLWLVWLITVGALLIRIDSRHLSSSNQAKQNLRSSGHFPTS